MVAPKIIFTHGRNSRDEVEARERGYWGDIVVEVEGGRQFDLTFYDPVRLSQDLERLVEIGEPYLAEPGLVVVPEVTIQNIEVAVHRLQLTGYFDRLLSRSPRSLG